MQMRHYDDPASGSGWSDSTNTLEHAGFVHGPWGNDVSSVSREFAMPPHTIVMIRARFWTIASWDSGEEAIVRVDNNVVWHKGKSIVCEGNKCYHDIEVATFHSAQFVNVQFAATINQALSDESWAFSQVAVYSDGARAPFLYRQPDNRTQWVVDGVVDSGSSFITRSGTIQGMAA